jgi:putative ubiquitin-RnfH superfamily antitoxin RatB of RatAB toxin-antitoxin module
MDKPCWLNLQVVWVDVQGQVQERSLQLTSGSTLQQGLEACGIAPQAHNAYGIWGRTKPLDSPLQEGDRLEAYQALKVDPKIARRERFAQQGARGAGLFASRRANSKAGY